MEKVLKLYKNLGETPLECLERFRVSNPEYANEKMTYAGRLDPMAEGLLIALVGEECKKKDEYLGLDKEYVFEVLFGFQSDTYDILGIPKIAEKKDFEIQSFVGKRVQEYPAYSSRTFQLARDGVDFEPPTKEVEIFDIEMLEEREIAKDKLLAEVLERIDLVRGDFRQDEIKESWKNILKNSQEEKFQITKMKVVCSSGTYVRSICNELGGLAYSIERKRVGNYKI
jgi:tRNA pseudouridine(55) synthase